VIPLKESERYREIARLVGGDMVSSLSNDHAKQMIEWCNQYKKTI
jgi:DNA repair ATPase RecN